MQKIKLKTGFLGIFSGKMHNFPTHRRFRRGRGMQFRKNGPPCREKTRGTGS